MSCCINTSLLSFSYLSAFNTNHRELINSSDISFRIWFGPFCRDQNIRALCKSQDKVHHMHNTRIIYIPTCLFSNSIFENVCSLSSDFTLVLYLFFVSLATSTTVFQCMKKDLVTSCNNIGTHLNENFTTLI